VTLAATAITAASRRTVLRSWRSLTPLIRRRTRTLLAVGIALLTRLAVFSSVFILGLLGGLGTVVLLSGLTFFVRLAVGLAVILPRVVARRIVFLSFFFERFACLPAGLGILGFLRDTL